MVEKNDVKQELTSVLVIDTVIALYDSSECRVNDDTVNVLNFKERDVIYIVRKYENGWWDGLMQNAAGSFQSLSQANPKDVRRGWVPSNFVMSIRNQRRMPYPRKNSRRSRSTSSSASLDMHTNGQYKNLHSNDNITSKNNNTSIQDTSKLTESENTHSFTLLSEQKRVNGDNLPKKNLESENDHTLQENVDLNDSCNEDAIFISPKHSLTSDQVTSISDSNSNSNSNSNAGLNNYLSTKPLKKIPNTFNYYNNRNNPININTPELSFKTNKNEYTLTKNQQGAKFSKENYFIRNDNDLSNWDDLYNLLIDNINVIMEFCIQHDNATRKSIDGKLISPSTLLTHLDLLHSKIVHIILAFKLISKNELEISKVDYKNFKKTVNVTLNKITLTLGTISLNLSLSFSSLNTQNDTKAGITENEVTVNYYSIQMELKNLILLINTLFKTLTLHKFHFDKTIPENERISKQKSKLDTTTYLIEFPQIVPRFLRNSFHGGAWINPFAISSDLQFASPKTKINSNNLIPYLYHTKNSNRKKISFISSINSTHSSSAATQKKTYSLTKETLEEATRRAKEINDKVYANDSEHINTLDEPQTIKRDLEINLKAYDEFNSNISLIGLLESLNLSIFHNLFVIVDGLLNENSESRGPSTGSQNDSVSTNEIEDDIKLNLDHEAKEFLLQSVEVISEILVEFFDIKQSLHNVIISIIMSAQQITLNDPFTFNSMRPNHSTDFYEPKILKNVSLERNELYYDLVRKDVENNNLEFVDYTKISKLSCQQYAKIAMHCCVAIDKLIQERELIINYAARTMKTDLLKELTKEEVSENPWYSSTDSAIATDDSKNINKIMEDQENYTWFLQLDYERELILDDCNMIKGGPLIALVEHLTNHQFLDKKFILIFLLTIKTIFKKKSESGSTGGIDEFLLTLIYRYNVEPPEGLSYDDYNRWSKEKSFPIKTNIVAILLLFFSKFWTDKYYNPNFMNTKSENIICKFIQFTVYEHIPGSEQLRRLFFDICDNDGQVANHDLEIVDQICVDEETNFFIQNLYLSKECIVQPVYFKASENEPSIYISPLTTNTRIRLGKKLRPYDIDVYVFATQLTLMEEQHYSLITATDCINRVWGDVKKKESTYISDFICFANNLTNFVSFSIVNKSDIKKRVRLIEFFIEVAFKCYSLNNYSSVTVIISAMYSSSIYRLQKTWNLVHFEYTDKLKKLNELMNSDKNFLNYRKTLRSIDVNTPCIPFFGIFLSDLTFVVTGNSDYLDKERTLINFQKRAKVFAIISEIIRFKNPHYNLKRIPEVYNYIQENLSGVPPIERQYELSLLIEPRTETSSTISKNKRRESAFAKHSKIPQSKWEKLIRETPKE